MRERIGVALILVLYILGIVLLLKEPPDRYKQCCSSNQCLEQQHHVRRNP